MRITNNMMIANMKRNLGNNQTRLNKYQNQLDTGKKIQVPSDDPVVAARALKLRTDVSKIEQYQKNLGDAKSWLDETDVTLGKIGDVLQKARELSEQAANGTNTPEETQKIGQELKQLRAQLVHLSNSTYAGRYIFSGFKTDQKLMVDDEQDPNYGKFNINVGTTREKIYYEIGVGDSININIAGGDLFSSGGNAANPGSGVARSDINDITFPFTVTAGNSAIDVTVNGINVTTTIPAVTYNTAGLLADAIKNAVNASPLLPAGPDQGIEVSIANNILEISTQAKSSVAAVSFNVAGPTNFFGSIGATPPVLATGATGDSPAMIQLFNDVIADMDAGNHKQISDFLDVFDAQIGNVLRCRADVGARQNRVDLSTDRMSMDEVNFTDLLSKNEDVDVAETIMNLKNEENVYQASLAGGARIIQQTLVDFLR
jgi:flagellar hook-associated protein 3 FlgL